MAEAYRQDLLGARGPALSAWRQVLELSAQRHSRSDLAARRLEFGQFLLRSGDRSGLELRHRPEVQPALGGVHHACAVRRETDSLSRQR